MELICLTTGEKINYFEIQNGGQKLVIDKKLIVSEMWRHHNMYSDRVGIQIKE